MLNKLFKYALPAILVICAAALCFKAMIEPDTWWQLAAGRYILAHGPVTHDVFSYTYFGKPWINIKWGYEVIAYIYASLLGAEMLPVLQWGVTVLMLFIFTKIIGYLHTSLNITTHKPLMSLILLAGMCGMAYRFNARPESITQLFTVLFIGLNYHRIAINSKIKYQKSKLAIDRTAFVIIGLQLIWANMHDAFVMGWVVTGVFAVSRLISSKSFAQTFKEYGLLLLGQIAIVCINSYGIKLLTQPLNTFNQFTTNTFTYELLDYKHSAWWIPEAYLAFTMLGMLVLSIAWLWIKDRNFERASFPTLLPLYILQLAFLYLGLKAQRNIAFIFIPLVPLVVVLYTHIIRQRFTLLIGALVLIKGIALWIWIASGYFYKDLYKRSEFGLYVNTESNPVGAAQYLKNNHLGGKRFFTDYLSSSYLMYGVPGFKTYVDLRDQDVFPDSFIATAIKQATIPEEFAKADSIYHFEGVILLRNQFKALHKYLYDSKKFGAVYGDFNTIIYVKRILDTTPTQLYNKYENYYLKGIHISTNIPEMNIFRNSFLYKPQFIAKTLTHFLNPFFEYPAMQNRMLTACEYYSTVGDRKQMAENISESNVATVAIIDMLQAEIYYDSSLIVKDSTAKLPYLNLTRSLLLKSYHIDSKNVQINIDLYAYYTHVHKLDSALYHAQKAFDANPYDAFAISTLASAHVNAGNAKIDIEDNFQEAIRLYKKLLHYTPDDPTTLFNIGALYTQLQDDAGKDYLQRALDTKQLSPEQEETARELIK